MPGAQWRSDPAGLHKVSTRVQKIQHTCEPVQKVRRSVRHRGINQSTEQFDAMSSHWRCDRSGADLPRASSASTAATKSHVPRSRLAHPSHEPQPRARCRCVPIQALRHFQNTSQDLYRRHQKGNSGDYVQLHLYCLRRRHKTVLLCLLELLLGVLGSEVAVV